MFYIKATSGEEHSLNIVCEVEISREKNESPTTIKFTLMEIREKLIDEEQSQNVVYWVKLFPPEKDDD